MDLDPAHLRSLQAIVRYGGYHRAAEALHLTQPAISRHIRRLEEQLGQPLFARRGRGVELTAFGERAAGELVQVLRAHDTALTRLARDGAGDGPFVFGTVENLVDPILPDLLAAVRDHIGDRPLQLRVDRSSELVAGRRRGEIDAAIVFDTPRIEDAVGLGTLTLRWWTAVSDRTAADPPDPLPLVAYDAPCALRDLSLAQIASLGRTPLLTAESAYLSGVHAAVRNGLGYALLAAGGDGLRAVSSGPLAEPTSTGLWLLVSDTAHELVAPLRAALRRATGGRPLSAVA